MYRETSIHTQNLCLGISNYLPLPKEKLKSEPRTLPKQIDKKGYIISNSIERRQVSACLF